MRQRSGDTVANGRYAIGEVVGRGRRSRVHACRDLVLQRPVALKFLAAQDSWRAEAAALGRVDHAHLVRLLDGGEAGDEAFLVLPLMAESLTTRIGRRPMSRDDAAAVVLALADALGHVHRAGMVHGAVDTDAVVLDPSGRPCWSGLPDPSATAKPRAVDADLHALAVVAVHCVTGDRSGRTAPSAVLDAVRGAADTGRTADLRRLLAGSLESVVASTSRPDGGAARVVRRVRLRGRPGVAAALAVGFAASVLGGIAVEGGAIRSGVGTSIGGSEAAVVLTDPARSDVLSSVGDALDRLGSVAAEPSPVESRVVPVADDGDAGPGDRPAGGGAERAAADPAAGSGSGERDAGDRAGDRADDGDRDGAAGDRDGDRDGDRGGDGTDGDGDGDGTVGEGDRGGAAGDGDRTDGDRDGRTGGGPDGGGPDARNRHDGGSASGGADERGDDGRYADRDRPDSDHGTPHDGGQDAGRDGGDEGGGANVPGLLSSVL